MKRYFKTIDPINVEQAIDKDVNVEETSSSKQTRFEIDLNDLPSDPGLRKLITDYHPNDRDKVRRAYLQKGPCQPHEHDFPQRKIGAIPRRFVPTWFKEYNTWLEYSISKDAAFCLCCYLYKSDFGEQTNKDSFVVEGFRNWKKKERFETHIGSHTNAHNQAWNKCEDLMRQKQHIDVAFETHSTQDRKEYRIRLTATIDCIQFLLHQGLAFRGNDESEDSDNKGNFLELLEFLRDHNEDIKKVTLDNAPGNSKLIASDIQKDVVRAASIETTKVIINDLRDELFAILIDESRDISVKEEMAIVLRYVNSKGCIIERFLGLVHVSDTTALSLKLAMEKLFSKHNLSTSRLRGQGYDGASNMNGEFNGLKALILKENPSAYYVHCFAHQLQLALVAVVKKHSRVALLFNVVSNLTNIVGASCKRRDLLREKQYGKVIEALQNGEIETGTGLHQETSLQRAGDTRWSSYYVSLVSLLTMFASVVDVLDVIEVDGTNSEQRGQASALLALIQSFEFVFNLHLMKKILGFTNDFFQALQRKEQDIINAIALVNISKQQLHQMRNDDDEWESFLVQVVSFCEKNSISVPNMDDMFVDQGRSRRNAPTITNLRHYRIDIFYTVLDMQLLELNDRFTEENSELLLCVACLNPIDSFAAYDKQKLIRLAHLYPSDFTTLQIAILENQLETYIIDLRSDSRFSKLKGIGDLAKTLVETRKNDLYPLVYLLVKLALILPVATASVERVFSAMNLVKTPLRNRLGDKFLNDCLVTYIEKKIFASIDNEKIIQRFQNMKKRRGQL